MLLYTGDHSPFAGPTERGPGACAVKALQFSDAPGAVLSSGSIFYSRVLRLKGEQNCKMQKWHKNEENMQT